MQVELAGWLGAETIQSTLLDKMPELMRKDLDKLLAEAGGAYKRPERFTRSEAAKRVREGAPAAPAEPGDSVSASAASTSAPSAEEDDNAQARRNFVCHASAY